MSLGLPPAVPARDLIFKEVTLTGFWLLNWLRHAPRAEIEQTYRTLSDLVATGAVAVPVDARLASPKRPPVGDTGIEPVTSSV
jgi:hypothetical protein